MLFKPIVLLYIRIHNFMHRAVFIKEHEQFSFDELGSPQYLRLRTFEGIYVIFG